MVPDQIHPRVCKEQADVITRPFSMIVEVLGIWTGPSGWNLANIFPIFKKARKEGPRNYRPVSPVSVTGKTIENSLGTIEETGTDQ